MTGVKGMGFGLAHIQSRHCALGRKLKIKRKIYRLNLGGLSGAKRGDIRVGQLPA